MLLPVMAIYFPQQSCPYNFYALMTILMVFVISFTGWDFGPMKKAEEEAKTQMQGEPPGYNSNEVKGNVIDSCSPLLY